MKKVEILIIDDHQIVEQGVINLVKNCFDNVKCYFSNNIRNAISVLNQHHIDIIISDLEFVNSTDSDGFYLAKYLKDTGRMVKSIALTHHNSYRIMKKALKSGFNSYLNKSCSEEDFTNTLAQVYKSNAENVYYSESMKILLKKRHEFYSNIFTDSLLGLSNLSEREQELVRLCVQTTDKHKLAVLMEIKHTTVDTHFKNILAKLQLKNRKELALFAAEFWDEIEKFKF